MTVTYYTFTGGSSLSTTITGLTAATTYYYDITAYNGTTPGPTSSVQSATTAASTSSTNSIVLVNNQIFDLDGKITEYTSTSSGSNSTLWYQNPGKDGAFWKLPFQTTAQWTTSGSLITSLRNGTHSSPTGIVDVKGNFAVPWVIGTATDPQVTVTNGSKSITVHIPLGTIIETPASSVDQSIGGADATQPYLVWSISGATMNTGSVVSSGSVITGTYGMQIDDGSGPIMEDAVTGQPGTNNSIGQIQDLELSLANASASYVIPHMLAFQMDPSQASGSQMAWPLKVLDGGSTFTGSIPQGVTIGIPASTTRPTGQTRGFYLLFDNLQQFGWFNYNFGNAGCAFITCYSNLSANASLVTDISNSISAVMAYVCILANQTGASSAKGSASGGTDAFPRPPALNLSQTNGVSGTLTPTYPSSYSG